MIRILADPVLQQKILLISSSVAEPLQFDAASAPAQSFWLRPGKIMRLRLRLIHSYAGSGLWKENDAAPAPAKLLSIKLKKAMRRKIQRYAEMQHTSRTAQVLGRVLY
jgi:hypothetical protein